MADATLKTVAETQNQPIPKTPEDTWVEENLLSAIKDDSHYKSYKNKYFQLENLYEGNISDTNDANVLQTQISSGEAFQMVETVLPRLIGKMIRPRVTGKEGSDKPGAKLSEQLMAHQIDNDDLEESLEDFIQQGVKTLAALVVDVKTEKTQRTYKKRKISMRIPGTQKTIGIGPLEEHTEEVEEFRHVFNCVPWNKLIIPKCRNYTTAPYLGFKFKTTLYGLKQDNRYRNLDQLAQVVAKKLGQDEYENQQDSIRHVSLEDPKVLEESLELSEVYYTYQGKKYLLCFAADFNVIVRNEPLPYWHNEYPMVLWSYRKRENSAIGISLLESTKDGIDAEDLWLNLMMTVGLFDVGKFITYDPDKLKFNWQKNPPVWKPGMAYPAEKNAFDIPASPKVDVSHLNIFNLLKNRNQNSTGLTDYISGQDQIKGEGDTLGEVQLKTLQSNRRFQLVVKGLRRALSRVFFLMNSNNQQYLPDNYVVRIFGENGNNWKKLSAAEIQGKYDYTVKGFESILDEQADIVNRYRAAISDALKLGPQLINIIPLVRGLYEEGYAFENIEDIVIPPQETLQANDQSKQVQAQKANEENKNPLTALIRPDDDHTVHMDVHEMFVKSAAFKALPRPQQVAIAKHIMMHRQAMDQGNQQQPGQPGQPQGTEKLSTLMPLASVVRPRDRNVNYKSE